MQKIVKTTTVKVWQALEDMQFVRKVDTCAYEILEATELTDDSVAIAKATINLQDYTDDNDEYTDEVLELINARFGSYEEMEEACDSSEECYIAVALMLFDEMPHREMEYFRGVPKAKLAEELAKAMQ